MKRSILGVVLVLTFVAVGIAAAPPLTFTFSDVKSTKTATETDSYGVNNAGVIAGDYIDSAGIQHDPIIPPEHEHDAPVLEVLEQRRRRTS